MSNLLALNRDWKIRELCDLEPREIRVLLNIGSYMPIKAADIAYQSRIDSYNVSRAVKSLQNKGLIDVQPSEYSRNIKFLVLNKNGTQLYHQVISTMEERATELESALDENEQVLFFQMLEKIENKAEQILAEQAIKKIADGDEAPADQKELIRWYKKSNQKRD